MTNIQRGYDVLGNLVIVKFWRGAKKGEKKKWALKFLREHKNVKTVLEKSEKFSGRLRTQKTKHIAGEKTKEALYRENGCVFRFNVDSCYFSSRLSAERKEVGEMVKRGERVLVLFGGVAPFAVVIAKMRKAARVVSVELGRECNKYALENVRRNKLGDKIEIVQGDVRKILRKWKRERGFVGFDRVIMARPNLKDSFLDITFPFINKGGIINYYGFYREEEKGELKKLIEKEALKARRKVKILRIKRAGEIGVKKYRYRADIRVY